MHQAMSQRPETLRQARSFDANKNHYLALGLCGPCAAQAAWGHQIGFSNSHRPCSACQTAIATFPTAQPGPWRSDSPRRGQSSPPASRSTPSIVRADGFTDTGVWSVPHDRDKRQSVSECPALGSSWSSTFGIGGTA
jgi:hypothetical protein